MFMRAVQTPREITQCVGNLEADTNFLLNFHKLSLVTILQVQLRNFVVLRERVKKYNLQALS